MIQLTSCSRSMARQHRRVHAVGVEQVSLGQPAPGAGLDLGRRSVATVSTMAPSR